MKKRIVVGAAGASAMPVLIKCLQMIKEARIHEICLIMSRGALMTLKVETSLNKDDIKKYGDYFFENEDIGAGPASGSFETDGMLIVPCSMKTVAGISSGYTDNLILRAADVTIKEHRPLVLAPRETPLSPIHLRNMYELSKLHEVRIIPPMMTFYNQPENIDDMVSHIAAKLVECFGIYPKEYRRWNG